jgi:hypothetical protein
VGPALAIGAIAVRTRCIQRVINHHQRLINAPGKPHIAPDDLVSRITAAVIHIFRTKKDCGSGPALRGKAAYLQQLKRYEIGKNEPSTEALRKIALSLHISTDALLFDEEERAPADDLNMFFEAINEFDDQDKASAKELLQALILKANAKKWTVSA